MFHGQVSRQRRHALEIEQLEGRLLLSAGAGSIGSRAFRAIQRDVKRDESHARQSPQIVADDNYALATVHNDLAYEGLFNVPARRAKAKRHDQIVGGPLEARIVNPAIVAAPTRVQTLAQFQAAYNQAVLQSAPYAAELLVLDAKLAYDVSKAIGILATVPENPAEIPVVSQEFIHTLGDIQEDVQKILENPLLETPAGQELAATAEEIAFDQAAQNLPIVFPTPPIINAPPVDPGAVPILPGSPIVTLPTGPTLPPLIQVNPQTMTFSTTAGNDPPPQTLTIHNAGGGSLHTTTNADATWITLSNAGNSPDGSSSYISVRINAAGLPAGTYHGTLTVSSPDDPGGTQLVSVTVHIIATTYSGTFTGYVQNDDGADGGSDAGTSFIDSYGGRVTMTVTQNFGGAYTLTFQGNLATTSTHDEDFSANFNVYVNVNNLGSISFTTQMGDGNMLVQGGIAGGTFSGTWRFQAIPSSNDSSDSGSGTFSLSI
jgi:hypothetical protein